jgi:hypothetical protein
MGLNFRVLAADNEVRNCLRLSVALRGPVTGFGINEKALNTCRGNIVLGYRFVAFDVISFAESIVKTRIMCPSTVCNAPSGLVSVFSRAATFFGVYLSTSLGMKSGSCAHASSSSFWFSGLSLNLLS